MTFDVVKSFEIMQNMKLFTQIASVIITIIEMIQVI